jgi:hypothetical protein
VEECDPEQAENDNRRYFSGIKNVALARESMARERSPLNSILILFRRYNGFGKNRPKSAKNHSHISSRRKGGAKRDIAASSHTGIGGRAHSK